MFTSRKHPGNPTRCTRPPLSATIPIGTLRGPHRWGSRAERGKIVESLRATQGMVGGYNWGTSLSTTPPNLPSIPQEGSPALYGSDQFDSRSLPSQVAGPTTFPGPTIEVPAHLPTIEVPLTRPGTGASVPTFLAGDQFDFSIGSAPSAPASSHSVTGLGVLAQLDEPTAAASVRAIDNQPRVNPFSDMHMVGPGNAKQFLGNPSALYLGM